MQLGRWFFLEGYKINNNLKYTLTIIRGLIEKNGYCPCKLEKIEENICPCDEFINTGKCHCQLFVERE